MPVYAATSPAFADRRLSPRALTLIIAGHAALIAAVMSSRMDIPAITKDPPLVIQPIPIEEPPPPDPAQPEPGRPTDERIFTPDPIVPVPPAPAPIVDPAPIPVPNPGPIIGTVPEPLPPRPAPIAEPVRTGPRFVTPADLVRPPYPASKLRMEEEATLRLRLAIDARGRVTRVEPVGSADPVFLEAARKHLVARWRYKPATEDGRAIASTTVITLRFELEG